MAELRLIDANALINVLHAKLCRIDNGRTMRQAAIPVADGMRIMELEYCIGLIQCADIIDAVPVVHGRWVPNHGSYGTPHCSNCKWRIPYSEDSTLDARSFCPNCGAKMDAKEE